MRKKGIFFAKSLKLAVMSLSCLLCFKNCILFLLTEYFIPSHLCLFLRDLSGSHFQSLVRWKCLFSLATMLSNKSLHLARIYACIFVPGKYLFQEANSLPVGNFIHQQQFFSELPSPGWWGSKCIKVPRVCRNIRSRIAIFDTMILCCLVKSPPPLQEEDSGFRLRALGIHLLLRCHQNWLKIGDSKENKPWGLWTILAYTIQKIQMSSDWNESVSTHWSLGQLPNNIFALY